MPAGYADSQNIGTLTLRVAGLPGEIKFGEWRWDRLWSTISWSDGDTGKRDFFVGSVGQAINGGRRQLSAIDTNAPRGGDNGLPIDWEMFIFSLRTRILDVVGTDTDKNPSTAQWEDSLDVDTPNRRAWFELDRKCLLTFKVNNKDRSVGRFQDYPSAGGLYLVTNDLAESYANNGMPSPRDAFNYTIPIHLRPNVSYKVSCEAVTHLDLVQAQTVNDREFTTVEPQVVFEGLVKLPVQ